MRKFDHADVLSVTTGHLVSKRHLNGVLELLTYMTGKDVPVHMYPRVVGKCAASLLEQYPKLSSVDASKVNAKNLTSWLSEQKAIYGDKLLVKPLNSVRENSDER